MGTSSGAFEAVHPPIGSSALRRTRPAWDGMESPWIAAAWAAAPWPLWSALFALGGGGAYAPTWLRGPLVLALVLTAMVLWAHRPAAPAALRWALSIVGTGVFGELAFAAVPAGLASGAAVRALGTWLLCVALYEVTPIVAAASRVSGREHRRAALDVSAHVLFFALAAAAYALPRVGALPWIAASIALPLAAAQSGPPRRVEAPPRGRGELLWGVALVAWSLTVLFFVVEHRELASGLSALQRRTADPAGLVRTAWPAVSLLFALGAALTLWLRAARLRRAPSGLVVSVGDRGVTLEARGDDEPRWVAIEGGPLPPGGASVTLVGAHERAPDAGPFRDGAPQWVAGRAWIGTPDELARALAHRAAGWVAWAAVGALGVGLALLAR